MFNYLPDIYSKLVIDRLAQLLFANQESLYAVKDINSNLDLKMKVLSLIDQPLLGNGLDYERLLIGTSAHNTYVSILFGGGVIAFFFFVIPIIWFWYQIFCKRYISFKSEASWLMIAILIIANASPIYNSIPLFFVFLLPFLLLSYRR